MNRDPEPDDLKTSGQSIDDVAHGPRLQNLLRRKAALRRWYCEVYARYRASMLRAPQDGLAVELGAGAGFARDVIPELLTADLLPYTGLDLVFDARRMPFRDQSVRFLGLMNVFHHIPDVTAFLKESVRCLKPGGRMLIVDQFPGWLSHWILKYAHHEPYDPWRPDWEFPSTGPLSGANGALAWIVFQRDRDRFQREFPQLQVDRLQTHTPLRYWLSGGLKSWTLLPGPATPIACGLESLLLRWTARWGSFMDIELVRLPGR